MFKAYPLSCDVEWDCGYADFADSTTTAGRWYPTVSNASTSTSVTIQKTFAYCSEELEGAIWSPKIKIKKGFEKNLQSVDFSYGSTGVRNITLKWNCSDGTAYGDDIATWTTNNNSTCYIDPNNFDIYYDGKPRHLKTPVDRLRDMIKERQGPLIIGTRKHLKPTVNPAETRARQTLQRVLGDDKFRSFLKNGFVSIRPKSGLVYKIHPGHGMTQVYDRGQHIETLCVVLKGNFPPTDSLIMRYLLILNSESEFRKHAISHSVRPQTNSNKALDRRPLTEIFRELKVA